MPAVSQLLLLLAIPLVAAAAVALDRSLRSAPSDGGAPSEADLAGWRHLLASVEHVSANNLNALRRLQQDLRATSPTAEQLAAYGRLLNTLVHDTDQIVHDLDEFRQTDKGGDDTPNSSRARPAPSAKASRRTNVAPAAGQTCVTELNDVDELISDVVAYVYGAVPVHDVLNFVFDRLRPRIPYERMGLALVNEAEGTVTAGWSKADVPTSLKSGFSASLEGSSLSLVLERYSPRILNDLPAYLRSRPRSVSTRLMVEAGFRSSLTCPITLVDGTRGFLFFSSTRTNTYTHDHVQIAKRIASALAGKDDRDFTGECDQLSSEALPQASVA